MSEAVAATGLGRRLVRNTLLAATGRLVTLASWWVLTPLVLRALGADGFAVWALFFALTGYLAALDLGLVQGTLRHVAAARQRGDVRAASAHVSLGLLGFLALGVVWWTLVTLLQAFLVSWLRIPNDYAVAAVFAMRAGAFVFVFAGAANVLMASLQAFDRFDLANGVSLAIAAIQAAGVLIALRGSAGLEGLVVAVGVGWASGALLGLFLVARAAPDLRPMGWRTLRSYLNEALVFGGPMQLASVMASLHLQMDRFLIPGMVALSALTPYELGARVPVALQTFPLMILLAMLPAAASLHAAGAPERLRELFLRGNRYLLVAIALLVTLLYGASDRLFLAWLGAGQDASAAAMRGMTLSTALLLTTGMGTVVVRAVGRTDMEAWFAATVLILHAAFSLAWIPVHGIAGAVAASIGALLLAAPVFIARMARLVGVAPSDVLLREPLMPFLASAAGIGVSLIVDRYLPWGGWAGVAAVSLSGALGAIAVIIGGRYLAWRELYALFNPSRS